MREPGQPVLDEMVQAALDVDGIQSAALFAVAPPSTSLELAAAAGIAGPPLDGLVAAVRNPAHPVARALSDEGPTFDVLPMAPGGPRLRSHVPLQVDRDGRREAVGVLRARARRAPGRGATNGAHRRRGDGRGGDGSDNIDLERLKRLTCDAGVSFALEFEPNVGLGRGPGATPRRRADDATAPGPRLVCQQYLLLASLSIASRPVVGLAHHRA